MQQSVVYCGALCCRHLWPGSKGRMVDSVNKGCRVLLCDPGNICHTWALQWWVGHILKCNTNVLFTVLSLLRWYHRLLTCTGEVKSDLHAVAWQVEGITDEPSPVTCCQGCVIVFTHYIIACNLYAYCLQCFDTGRALACKNWVIGCRCAYLSGVRCSLSSWCHCHPKTSSSFVSSKFRMPIAFWCWFAQVFLENRPLFVCFIVHNFYNLNDVTIDRDASLQ